MDRRMVLAIGLMLLVAILPQILFPPETPPPGADGGTGGPVDSAVVDSAMGDSARRDAVGAAAPTPMAPETVFVQTDSGAAPAGPPARPPVAPGRLVTVESDLYRFQFSTRGARLVTAGLKRYDDLAAPGDVPAQLVPDSSEFLRYRVLAGADTISLGDWEFTPDVDTLRVGPGGATLTWTARRGAAAVRLVQRFVPDHYLFDVQGELTGFPGSGGLVLVGLGPRLRSVDADSATDIRSYGVVTKARSTESLKFRSLDYREREALEGPFEWVAVKSKYFVAAAMAIQEGQPRFGGAIAIGGAPSGAGQTRVHVEASLPAPGGRFAHAVYVGPQEYRRLARIGHDFQDVNPYGWIFRPIIRPVANFIVRILLWMHENLNLAYGWVLVLFGIAVRVLLWPLNQKAMRSSTAMQAIQPELKALQDRYKSDPQKLQQEMLKLYREHGVNPLGGCLPMLMPMPILFALFFVFANTIEFRGVPFLWLPDLSRHDPYYIIPLLMGASMFVVTKLGQRGVAPNPQAKMMTYVLPPLFTVMFARFSAGLNLYYAVSNIASIPQQWMISKERMQKVGARKKASPP